MLLKSWATPPASRPTDSIFCAWSSWSSSLARSPSARFRSVMSMSIPESSAGRPSWSRTSSPASAQTVRVRPSGRQMRYSMGSGRPSSSTCWLMRSIEAWSSGWTVRAMTPPRSPVKVPLSTPKSRYISSDHSTFPVWTRQDELPTWATPLRPPGARSRRRSVSSDTLLSW